MASPEAGEDPPPAQAAANRKRILIVEDNPLNMKLFAAMITAEGYQVLQAIDGPGGLDLARRQHPDLIIMDIQLPGLSGLDVTHSLKADAATRDIPIVATSAFTQPEDIERARASGVDSFMAKPIAISEFLDMIAAFMAERREPKPAPLA